MAATTEPTTAPTSQESLPSLLRDLLPPQGAGGEREYLWLTDHTNRLIELTGGRVQELPMPTDTHQAVLPFLYLLFPRSPAPEPITPGFPDTSAH